MQAKAADENTLRQIKSCFNLKLVCVHVYVMYCARLPLCQVQTYPHICMSVHAPYANTHTVSCVLYVA